MIQLKQFVFNPFQENTYLLYVPDGEGIIVDPGCSTDEEFKQIIGFIESERITIKCLVNTHCHIDHILGISSLKERFGAKAYAHIDDLPLLQMAPNHAMAFGLYLDRIPVIDETLNHNDILTISEHPLRVIHTPGHSPGGICIYAENEKFLLSGDTLFNLSIGRTDLAGGNFETLINSINQYLLILPDKVVVYPGHGDKTTIGFERKSNPFINQ